VRLSLSLGALASLQLAAGLVLQLTVLVMVGAGADTDAWVAAQAVPFVLLSIASVSFQGTWQAPLAVAAVRTDDWMKTQRVVQGQVLLMTGGVAAVLSAAAFLWVPWLFPGLTAAQWALTCVMTHVLLVSVVLNAQSALLTSALRGRNQFLAAEAVAFGGSVAGIVFTVALLAHLGIAAAAWSQLLRALIIFGVLFWIAGRPVPSLRGAIDDRASWRLSTPLMFGSTLYKTGPIVDRYWTSLAPVGGMTVFNLAQLGMGAVASVLERALCVPAIPALARFAASCDYAGMRHLYRQRLVRTGIVTGLVLLALVTVRPWWDLLVGPFLKLDAAILREMWWLCLLLVGYLFVAAAGSMVVSSFQALRDTATPVRVGVIGFAVSLPLKAAGFLVGGLPGLALAIVVHYAGGMIVMSCLLERRLTREEQHGPARV
jgi:peptidoglycan biosynthesis protein MviN/MurJ (putative lipid II flippase)